MKCLSRMLLSLCVGMLVSCAGLPSSLPPTVTDPVAIGVYNSAKEGNGDALYQMSLIYRKGLYGFPKSKMRARQLVKEAAAANPPSATACFDYFRAHIHAKQDTIKARAIKNFCKAFDYNEPRALALFSRRNPNVWNHDPIREMERLVRDMNVAEKGYVVCPQCHGLGKTLVERKKTVGSSVVGNVKYIKTAPVWVEEPCGYCRMIWRQTPYPGYIRR